MSSAGPAPSGAGSENALRGIGLQSLVLLIAQNSAAVLLIFAAKSAGNFDTTTVLFWSEALKFVASCLLAVWQAGWSPRKAYGLMLEDAKTTRHPLQMAVPAGLYLLQNNLLFAALARLSPVVFQMSYQLKVPATAAFSVILLGRRFARAQIVAMLTLMVGVVLVQLDRPKILQPGEKERVARALPAALAENASTAHLLGFAAVFICATTSGFASVYFERVLKSEASPPQSNGNAYVPLEQVEEGEHHGAAEQYPEQPKLSMLVITNIYLSAYSVFALPFIGLARYGKAIPLPEGFTTLLWSIVVVQALGGLVIALVIRYSDNVTKTFALTLSVIICALVQVVQFHLRPGLIFCAGCLVVTASTYVYGLAELTTH